MAKKKAEKHAAECEEEADAEELAMLKCGRNAARDAEKHKSLSLLRSNSRSHSHNSPRLQPNCRLPWNKLKCLKVKVMMTFLSLEIARCKVEVI